MSFHFLTFFHQPLDALKSFVPRDLTASSAFTLIMLEETGSCFGPVSKKSDKGNNFIFDGAVSCGTETLEVSRLKFLLSIPLMVLLVTLNSLAN